MAAVFEILSMVTGTISAVLSLIVDILGQFGIVFFVVGFFGLLGAFLWFFFRFIDKRRLALPAAVFALSFVIFLSGNILLLAQDARTKGEEIARSAVEASASAELEEAAV